MFTINDFEKANPGYYFDQFKLNDDRTVRKVIGKVKVNKKTIVCGKPTYVESDRKVRWDANGRCYSITGNNRLRNYDITFK